MNAKKCKNLRKFSKNYKDESGDTSIESQRSAYKSLKKAIKNDTKEYLVIKDLLKRLQNI